MNTPLRHTVTDLPRSSTLRVHDGAGQALVIVTGQVWITQDNDPRDVVLGPGGRFSFDRDGLSLVLALRDSELLLVQADEPLMPSFDSATELHRIAREQRSARMAAALNSAVDRVTQAVAHAVARTAASLNGLAQQLAAHATRRRDLRLYTIEL
jgi:hypothetical protein